MGEGGWNGIRPYLGANTSGPAISAGRTIRFAVQVPHICCKNRAGFESKFHSHPPHHRSKMAGAFDIIE